MVERHVFRVTDNCPKAARAQHARDASESGDVFRVIARVERGLDLRSRCHSDQQESACISRCGGIAREDLLAHNATGVPPSRSPASTTVTGSRRRSRGSLGFAAPRGCRDRRLRLTVGDCLRRSTVRRFCFHLLRYPNYGALTFTPAGLSPAEHASLTWTHLRTKNCNKPKTIT
jgi:hypothetical protein